MGEIGQGAAERHFKLGQQAVKQGAVLLGLCGSHAKRVADGAMKEGLHHQKIRIEKEPERLAPFFISHLQEGQALLVKGSRFARMERLVLEIMKEKQP